MQTFLPYPDYSESAQCLDNKRLGKQRVECFQILRAIDGIGGYQNHPAVRMWVPYKWQLIQYGLAVCLEWTGRGFQDTCFGKIYDFESTCHPCEEPEWLGDPRLHASHRSNLLRKSTYYSRFGWSESTDLPYFWPL